MRRMAYRHPTKKVARIRIAGPDKKGIIAAVTGYLSENNCNIEDIDQRILDDFLIMNMLVDISDLKKPLPVFLKVLRTAADRVGTEAEFKSVEKKAIKNVGILVTKEAHCLVDLLKKMKQSEGQRLPLKGKPVVIIGNYPYLEPIAKNYKVPFFLVPSENRKQHEQKVLELLARFDVDLVVLARYMQILSPDFVFRHEGRIINIHPSLLPAFPGPRAYHQAYNKGVEIVGVTAHFVTTDLDEGPIITQGCFRVDKTRDTVEKFIARGRRLEADVLTRAVKMFLDNRLFLRRGKVIDSKKMRALQEKTKEFYDK